MALRRLATVAALAAAALVTAAAGPAAAARPTDGDEPVGSPVLTELAAEWFQWALARPADGHPLAAGSGPVDCSAGQEGRTWFLGGTFFGSQDRVDRVCTEPVPTGTRLFFPAVNSGYFGFLNDPPETRTPEFCYEQIAVAGFGPAAADRLERDAVVRVDGREVDARYVQTGIFAARLAEENLFGLTEADVPELRLEPSCAAGVHALLRPLPPGPHTISFQAHSGDVVQDVTYRLTVAGGRSGR